MFDYYQEGGNDSLSYLNEIMCLILKDWIEQKDLDRNNIFDFFWFNFWFEILRDKVMFSRIKNEKSLVSWNPNRFSLKGLGINF